MMISQKQVALLHIAKKRLGLDDDVYREVLFHFGGVRSSLDLDQVGFGLVMEAFGQLGFQSDFTRRNFGARPGMASAAQVALIRELWSEYTDGEGDDASLGKWLERTFKLSAIRFVTAAIAPKAITALKAMNAKKAAKADKKKSA